MQCRAVLGVDLDYGSLPTDLKLMSVFEFGVNYANGFDINQVQHLLLQCVGSDVCLFIIPNFPVWTIIATYLIIPSLPGGSSIIYLFKSTTIRGILRILCRISAVYGELDYEY